MQRRGIVTAATHNLALGAAHEPVVTWSSERAVPTSRRQFAIAFCGTAVGSMSEHPPRSVARLPAVVAWLVATMCPMTVSLLSAQPQPQAVFAGTAYAEPAARRRAAGADLP